MQNRRHFLYGGLSTAAAGLAGASALVGARGSRAAEAPPETTTLRFAKYEATCLAPLYIIEDLLRDEGFTEVNYVLDPEGGYVSSGKVDFGQSFIQATVIGIDAGEPLVALAGVHPGCFEVFARESVRSIRDLKGKNVSVRWDADRVILSIIAASVGLDPAKDINWIVGERSENRDLFADGKFDAFLAWPPEAQELHARDVGHVIFSSTLNQPFSQYFCCLLLGNADFVRRNPIATKRVVRALVRATDICASKPDWVARRLIDGGFAPQPQYDYVRQGLSDVPYRKWRDYDAEDSIRFYALRLHELGMIKSTPDKIIAKAADWRFLNEVKQEMGI
jgi:NitT/TauT family transport system substrate-binding protein